jgi:hypothetical protein
MKKIQTMMAVVLVALMAFAVQSCGSDKNDDNQRYTIEFSLKIDQPGNLTQAECQELINMTSQKSGASERADDNAARQATSYAADLIAEAFRVDKDEFGDAVMTCTIECKRVGNKERVDIWYVTYEKGVITKSNGRN